MERGARGMVYLLAVGVGILSWLAAVVIVTAILLGVLLLLNALAQRYWPQDIRQSLDSVHTATTSTAAAQEDQQRGRAAVVRE
jgi:CBS-domain-containing membrane protein